MIQMPAKWEKTKKNSASIQNNVAKMWKCCIEPKIIFVNRLLYHLNTEICQRVRKNNWHHSWLKGSRFTCTVYWAIFVWPWKMVSVSVRYLFYQPMDEKIKTWPFCFLTKENPNTEKASLDWPIVFQYDIKEKYMQRLISRKFSGMKFFHPSVRLTNPKATCIYIRWIKQSNH